MMNAYHIGFGYQQGVKLREEQIDPLNKGQSKLWGCWISVVAQQGRLPSTNARIPYEVRFEFQLLHF